MTTEPPAKPIGCLGVLALPFSTVAVAARLLFTPATAVRPLVGPYRAAPPVESSQRPLTPGATRFVAAMLLFWTLVLPLAFAARGCFVYRESVAGIVGTVMIAWIGMFVGHLVGAALFGWLEPRLPHVGDATDRAS